MKKHILAQEEHSNNLEQALEGLRETIARCTEQGEKQATAIPGLSLFRREQATEPVSGMYEPSICMVAQGEKRVRLGEDIYTYDAHNYLITAVHLPTVVQVVKASPEKPYLGLRLTFNQHELAKLMANSHLPPPKTQQSHRGMATGEVSLPLVNAVQRLLDLLAEEQDIPILAPVIQREILYRLLVGDQGARLRQIAAAGTKSQQIARAIGWLKENFNQPLRIVDLALQAGMSTSTFHHHFRRAVKFLQEHESSCKIEIFTNLFNRNGHVSAQLHFSRRKSADSISQPDEFNGTSSKNS